MDMRKLVKKGYEEGNYNKTYKRSLLKLESFEKEMINQLLIKIPKKSKILDFGCGVGAPYDKFFVKNNYDTTGIDISPKHLAIAKKNVPNATFLLGDFSKINFSKKFDAIVSFYAIFHIPRAEHKKLFEKMHETLNENGLILITLGAYDMNCDIDDFVGSKMAWSSYDIEKNKKLIRDSGFKILIAAEDNRSEHHLWILAKKI